MRLTTIIMLLLVTGCRALVLENTEGTLAAENRTIVTEAAQIRSTLTAEETRVQGTAVAGETVVAAENNINAVLLATVRAGDPPTVAVRAQIDRSVGALGGRDGTQVPVSVSGNAAGTVVTTYTAPAIRDQDGCGTEQQFSFELGITRIFAVQQVQAIPGDTLVGAEWYFNGAMVFEDRLLVTEFAENLCVWFFLEPYSAGNWSVQFTSNGNLVGQRVNFEVVE